MEHYQNSYRPLVDADEHSSPTSNHDSNSPQLESDKNNGRRRRWRCIAIVILVVCVICGILYAVRNKILVVVPKFVELCKGLGWKAGPLFTLANTTLIVCCMGEVTPILFGAAGAIFVEMYGVALGLTLSMFWECLGVYSGCFIGFMLARTLLKPRIQRLLNESAFVKVINKVVELEGWKIVFLAFSSPITPSSLVYVLGLTSLTSRTFAIGNLGNIFPTALVVYFGGSAAAEESDNSNQFWVVCIVNFLILVAAVILAVHATKRYNAAIAAQEGDLNKAHADQHALAETKLDGNGSGGITLNSKDSKQSHSKWIAAFCTCRRKHP